VVRLTAVLAAAAALATVATAVADSKPGRIEAQIGRIEPGTNAESLAVTPDGRIVVAGTRQGPPAPSTFVKAYLPDGTPDAAFGTGGEVRFDVDYRQVVAMAVEPDGQLLLARSSPPALHRLNRDGSPDLSFGDGGTVPVDFGDGYFPVLSLARYPDGRILVAGRSFTPDGQPALPVHGQPGSPVQLRRFLPSGQPDPSFGTGGYVEQVAFDPGFHVVVALQPSGKIVLLVPSVDPGFWIMRFHESGEPDFGFGRGGLAGLNLANWRWEQHVHPPRGFQWAALVRPDGRIRIPITFGERATVTRLGLVGLTRDGQVDHRFGRRGLALGPRQDFGEGGEDARVAVLDEHRSILMAGSISRGDELGGDEASVVRRFRANGTLDHSFGRRGLLRVTLPGGGAPLEQLLAMLDSDTAVLVDEQTVARYSQWNGGRIRALGAGHDRERPSIGLVTRCGSLRVRIRDLSPLEKVVVRADGAVVRRTTRKRFRVRLPGARSVFVRATDVAGNTWGRFARLPRC
jgi:uncharacterized delta-60 repeat protein